MWKDMTLGEYYDVRDGTHDSPQYVEDGYPLVTSKNLKNGKIDLSKIKYISEKDYQHINKRSGVDVGDVLMAMIGTIGNPVEIIEPPKFAIKNVALFKTNAQQSPAYLRYFLSHPDTVSKMMSDAKGTTQKFVGLGYLRNFPILVPPLAEQERIVAKLDAVFAEIDEAVENINLKETKLDNLKSVIISDSFRDNGWDNKKLGDCVSYEKKNAKGSSLPYVGMENITPETMNLIGEVAIPESTSSSFHFNKSHVLFGRLRPYLRKVLVPDFTGQCSTEIFCIKPEDNVIREFLAYWLLEQKISSKIEATSTGARMPRANMNALLEFDFPIPSIKEQKKITSKLDITFAKISKATNTLAKSKYNYFCLKSAILSQELQSSEAA